MWIWQIPKRWQKQKGCPQKIHYAMLFCFMLFQSSCWTPTKVNMVAVTIIFVSHTPFLAANHNFLTLHAFYFCLIFGFMRKTNISSRRSWGVVKKERKWKRRNFFLSFLGLQFLLNLIIWIVLQTSNSLIMSLLWGRKERSKHSFQKRKKKLELCISFSACLLLLLLFIGRCCQYCFYKIWRFFVWLENTFW